MVSHDLPSVLKNCRERENERENQSVLHNVNMLKYTQSQFYGCAKWKIVEQSMYRCVCGCVWWFIYACSMFPFSYGACIIHYIVRNDCMAWHGTAQRDRDKISNQEIEKETQKEATATEWIIEWNLIVDTRVKDIECYYTPHLH